jgi:hypothetical protein
MTGTRVSCPACGATLKTSAPLPVGKKIKCPKCATLFAVGAAETRNGGQDSALRPKEARAPSPSAIRPIPRHKAAPMPRELADDDDRPAQRVRERDEDRPSRPAKKRKKRTKSVSVSPVLVWSLAGGGAVAALAIVAILIVTGVFDSGTTRTTPPGDTNDRAQASDKKSMRDKNTKIEDTVPARDPGPKKAADPTSADDLEAVRAFAAKHRASAGFFEKHGAQKLAVWRAAAEKGSPEAQWFLSRCYSLGVGVAKDEAKALTWLRRSAEQGCGLAQNTLATYYERGDGVPQSLDEATEWFRKGAQQGEPFAQHNLANYYSRGSDRSKPTLRKRSAGTAKRPSRALSLP